MCNVRMGYLTELKQKESFFSGYGDMKKVLVSQSKLSELLTKPSFYIISARSVNVPEYQAEHADDHIEEWGF